MKINVEDLDKIIRLSGCEDSSGLRMALAHTLIEIWDRGYEHGQNDAMDQLTHDKGECPPWHCDDCWPRSCTCG